MTGVRFRLISLVALAGVIALTVAGILAAPVVIDVILGQVAHRAPHATIVFTDSGEAARAQAHIVVALVIPWLIAWLGLLVLRIRFRAGPSAIIIGLAFAAPTPIVATAMALRTWLFLGLVQPAAPSGVEPMLAVGDLAPGSWGIRFALVATTVFIVVLGFLAKPNAKDGPKRG